MTKISGRWQMCNRTVAATLLVVGMAACNSSAPPESVPENPQEVPGSSAETEGPPIAPEPDLKVAFFGDQGITAEAEEVLELVREEGADMVIHTGDLDYKNDPAAWDAMVTNALGSDVPYFVVMGNHDESAWDGPEGYQRVAWERLADLPGVECVGVYGEQSTCTYRGLWFLLSGVGVDDRSKTSHANFIQEECSAAPYLWKITNWHQNQTEMQVGDQNNQTGWRVYEESLSCGAIISTAHEHSYARTRTLTSTRYQVVDPACDSAVHLCVGPERTFAFHSGLGGHSIREQARCFPEEFPFGCEEWAHIYTASQDATYGALFMTFNVGGDPAKAEGYFKNIDGQVVDSFTVTAETR